MGTLKYEGHEIFLETDEYTNNDNLSICINNADTGEYESDITINIDKLPKNHAALDIMTHPFIEDFILQNKLGVRTDIIVSDTSFNYPVFKFNTRTLKKYTEEGK